MLSSKPVKLPRGETRPVALGAKRPLGTAEDPLVIIGRLSAIVRKYLLKTGGGHTWPNSQIVNCTNGLKISLIEVNIMLVVGMSELIRAVG